MSSYLFILGRNPELSRAELKNFCDEVWYSPEKSLFIGENLRFENPRNLPKTSEQIFLDRLGGVVRFGEILGEFRSEKEVQKAVLEQVQKEEKEGKIYLGATAYGCGKKFLKPFLMDLKTQIGDCRIENYPLDENMTSARIFNAKLLKKGYEFVVVKNKDSFLLAQTVANQNLRNYELRDRKKNFRDAKMGMLPPKLAQILINLANPEFDEVIIDPFCGSGTIGIEAAIMGYRTIGSDLSGKHVQMAEENFAQMAEKFRYEKEAGEFFAVDATKFPKEKLNGILVTEGTLGFNFKKSPNREEIDKNAQAILDLWGKIFEKLENSKVQKIAFCLPAWNLRGKTISISEKLFAKIGKSSYTPLALFGNQKTFLYARPDAFVAREICVLEKK